jgi:hypothetical protein
LNQPSGRRELTISRFRGFIKIDNVMFFIYFRDARAEVQRRVEATGSVARPQGAGLVPGVRSPGPPVEAEKFKQMFLLLFSTMLDANSTRIIC